MPVHDWTRVDAGILHAFQHHWISTISGALNAGILSEDYYALSEPHAPGFGPDVLAFEEVPDDAMEFYRRKQTPIVVRHVSGDRVVAMIEIVSPGNNSLRSFVEKAATLLNQRVHLLIVDLLPPGRHDPNGIHAAIWDYIAGQEYQPPGGQPLTLAAYETALTVRAYVRTVAVGDVLPEMPLFLEPNGCVSVPLEATYQTAFEAMPWRWRRVLEATP
jgi:hypothetical protein